MSAGATLSGSRRFEHDQAILGFATAADLAVDQLRTEADRRPSKGRAEAARTLAGTIRASYTA